MDPVARERLRKQAISHPLDASPEEVVRRLGAVQSQDYLGGKWSVALRLRGVSDADMDAALDSGRILRTHILRPTWHFVLPEDIRWMQALTSPRVTMANASHGRRMGHDAKSTARGLDAIAKALEGGNHLTREELAVVLRRKRVNTEGDQRLAYLMMQAELDLVVASGPRRGKQFTYALLSERAPVAREPALDRDEALARLATRYFAQRAPATVRDLARWATLTLKDAKRAVEAAGLDAETGLAAGADPRSAKAAKAAKVARGSTRRGHLLSVYDEYVNGYRDRSAIITPAHARAAGAMGNMVTHVFVIDGQVLGTWSRTIGPSKVDITANPFDATHSARELERLLAPAAKAYADFLGVPHALSIR